MTVSCTAPVVTVKGHTSNFTKLYALYIIYIYIYMQFRMFSLQLYPFSLCNMYELKAKTKLVCCMSSKLRERMTGKKDKRPNANVHFELGHWSFSYCRLFPLSYNALQAI